MTHDDRAPNSCLTFDAKKLRSFLETSRQASHRRGSFEQNYNVTYLRDDLDAKTRAHLIADAEPDGYCELIDPHQHICNQKIPVGLHLVGDRGIYMMSNSEEQEVDSEGKLPVAYAEEADIERLGIETALDVKRSIFGGDDGVIFLSDEVIESMLARSGQKVVIEMTNEAIFIVETKSNSEDEPSI